MKKNSNYTNKSKSKKKIKIIAAKLTNPGLLNIFEKLISSFDISVFVLESSPIFQYKNLPPLNFYVYKDNPELVSYMTNMEKNLFDADLIITLEATNLASLQAYNFAQKEIKPFAVIINEFKSHIYENYDNIKTMQMDILQNADKIWVSSDLALSSIKAKGIDCSKISKITYTIDESIYTFSNQKRIKFRDYVGLDSNSFVAIFYQDLHEYSKAINILLALKYLKEHNISVLENFKLIFIGNGSLAKDLKYKVYDWGLSKYVLFMHDIPFKVIEDVYCAADMIFYLSDNHLYMHEEYPMFVLEAVRCGIYPVVSHFTPVAELIKDIGTMIIDESWLYLANELEKLLLHKNQILQSKQNLSQKIYEKLNNKNLLYQLEQEINNLITNKEHVTQYIDYQDQLCDIEKLIEAGLANESLTKIQNILDKKIPFSELKAKLFYLKANAYELLSNWEEALVNYQQSLELNPNNYQTYEALGLLSYKTHAMWEAKRFFKKALSLNDKSINAMIGLALVYEKELKPELSLYWLEKCLHLDKTNSKTISLIVQICLNPNIPSSFAIEILERLTESLGEIPQLILALGQLYCKNGNINEGQKLIEKAISQIDLENKITT